ncbi:hypothetical protein BD309DRAFT_663805 [Dichomitus squalens]|uniref:Uncharacterized protein n=1 Tax=Dichomitus squalens TaxID=114155 RepID=A0A4Q9NY87_9APHY|nr:hypothetical protein BD309DRAFT_663805 [Dichomitus squalens]TBU60294.1 hypothetical protein BD310DRAFT_340496 [Dichomitus squalens]
MEETRGDGAHPTQNPFDDAHARTTPAGVHPYSSPAASSAAVNTSAPATGAAGEKIRSEDVPREVRELPPPKKPKKPLWKRRWFIISQIVAACLGIAILFILLYPVIHAIAQHILKVSVLHVDAAQITSATNNSFTLKLDSWVSHASIFKATIKFNEPLSVAWYNASGDRVPIGAFQLEPLRVRHKRAYINQTVAFNITDEHAFSQFTQAMITQPNFTWHLSSNKLEVQALKFPKAHGLHFSKDVTLKGMDNFAGNVELVDFQLPADDPKGGIEFVATTGLSNPSAFDVDLGTVSFDLSYKGVYLGTGAGPNTVVRPGPNNVTLKGTLVPQNGTENLATVSELFTNFLNGDVSDVVAAGRSSVQADGAVVGWLSDGLTALQLHVPFKHAAGAISPIKSIAIGDMALAFTPGTAWAPLMDSRTVRASMELPFGFGVSIGQIANSFNITKGGAVVGGLSTPESASTSEIHVVNSTFTQGTINITIDSTPLVVPDGSHPVFSGFNRNLTDSTQLPFQLEGHARAVANMSIGQITLDPIKFNVTSGLDGLQGLNNLVEIGSVDVVGGSTEAIHLSIPVNITNPSNLQLSTGNLNLQLFRGDAAMGTTLMPNLTLQMGHNSLMAQGNFTPNGSPQGIQTLNDFVGGSDVEVLISGYSQSTAVGSLLEAFESLNITATLPALKSNLLNSASLEVLPSTGRANDLAHTTVSLANPFTADLVITSVQSNVTFHGITLGTIDQEVRFASKGKSTTDLENLDLVMNMDPQALFTVTRVLAQDAGLDTAQLDAIVQLGGYQYLNNLTASVRKRDNLFTGFDLPTYVDKAFANLTSDVSLVSGLTIGDYQTTLTYTQPGVQVKTDKSLNFILPVLAQPIVQKIVTGSVLGVETVLIKDIKEDSFGTTLKGSITNAGPFDAKIAFPEGLVIEWNGKALGSMNMPEVNVVADVGATFEVDTTFSVADVGHLTDFTKVMLTEESFEWVISGSNLTVSAIGIDTTGVALSDKRVTLKGMNSLKDGVKINSFDLPSNDPAGGIHLTLNTSVTNPSQVGVALDSIAFQNFFQNVNIGPASSGSAFSLSPQTTVELPLTGRLVPQSSQDDLAAVSLMFNNFLHGKDSNITVQGDGAGPTDVTWLNEGIKALTIQTILPNQGVLDIINAVSLNELDLRFTEATAFDPAMGSDDTIAKFSLPFNFPVDIVAVAQNITVGADGTDFAELVIPKGPSTTDVEQRIIHLTFSQIPFAVLDGQRAAFEQFLATTAMSANVTMSLKGNANTDADTAVGVLSLTDIAFDVQTSIAGLQGLNAKPAEVTSLDVNHGFPDYLLIKVTSSLYNPSNITLGSGDVAFGLQFDGDTIGEADLSNLIILPGNQTYPIDVHYQPQGSAVASGQKMLENYLQGVLSATTIQGSTDATPIESLQLALSEIRLSPVNIPPLHQNLITTASLVFPTNIAQTGLAQTSFTLANPFTASINLLEVTAVATFGNLTLGKIDHVDRSGDPIHADGHANISSPTLPFAFNLDPVMIIELLFAGAQNNHVDLGPLPDVFQIVLANPGAKTNINVTVDTGKPPCASGKQFDVNDAILNSLKNLVVELGIDSAVKIDDYATDLAFNQSNVKAITDDTSLYLIGVVAPPIVQTLVDQSKLTFDAANITNISDDGFDLALKGSLTGTGPFDAQITFVEPVTVTWQGSDIAQIALPPVCASANEGAPDYETSARLTITDNGKFTDFATFLLHNEEFTWTISTDKLRLTALGETFDGVSLKKDISFKAFNNLPGVTISNFQLPSDDPAGGIHIETDSMIPSPAQLGIDLGTVTFESSFKGVTVGPLSGQNAFLAPQTVSNLHLSGRITPKTGNDLEVIGELFTNYLHAQNQTLAVQGESVQPTGSNAPVGWLSTAFKTLTLEVTLPGQSFDIIQSIDMADLELVMTEQGEAFAPLASSKYVLAQYKNPFGFSLQVVKSGEDITLGAQGADVAELNLPQEDAVGGVSTGNVVPLVLTFQNQTLQSLNDGAFTSFFAAVTDTSGVSFELRGSADVVARTTAGDIPINAIPFNVTTSLKGINGFGHTASLSNVSITGAGTDSHGAYIRSPLTTTLNNPSNVSLETVDVELPVYYKDVLLGRAVIDPLNLVPGDNELSTEFRYAPNDANDTTAQAFLTEFLQTGDTIPLSIKGDGDSSPFASLVPGLEGAGITTNLKGLNVPPIVAHINAYITLDTLFDNFITIDFDIANPLDTDMEISFTQVDSGVNNETYAHFDQPFDSFVIPAHSTANSGSVPNVLLTQGAIASLGIIPLGELDVFSVATVKIGPYTIPWLHLTTLNVKTDYHLSLSISEMKKAAQSISGSKADHTQTASVSGSASGSSAVAPASTTYSSDASSAASVSAQPSSTAQSDSSGNFPIAPPTLSEASPKASANSDAPQPSASSGDGPLSSASVPQSSSSA